MNELDLLNNLEVIEVTGEFTEPEKLLAWELMESIRGFHVLKDEEKNLFFNIKLVTNRCFKNTFNAIKEQLNDR